MEKQSPAASNFQCNSTLLYQLVQRKVPADVHSQDALVLVSILQEHTHSKFRLARTDVKFWNDIIRDCDPIDGKITQLSIYGFGTKCIEGPTLMSRLDKLERLELRDCRSLPTLDLSRMKSLKWLNLSIGTNFLIPNNRDWYPPNLKTFLIYGYKVKGDPLDALIATSILMQSPPIELNCAENDIEDILLSDGIGPFVKYNETSGRISELRLSSVVPNTIFQRSAKVDLPSNIGRLEMLKKLYLHNVSSIPKEISKLVHLRLLRLDNCCEFSDYPDNIDLPSVVDLQLRSSANRSILRWIVTSFPKLRSLKFLNMDLTSLENIFEALGKRCGARNTGSSSDCLSICFRKSLHSLQLSAAIEDTAVPDLQKALFGILENLPGLSKIYIERVTAIRNIVRHQDAIQNRLHLECLMAMILERYPRVRGLSIGGPNIITVDNRQNRRRPLDTDYLTKTSYPQNHPLCDILLNLNRCGRVLLNPPLSSDSLSCWIPASLWPHVLERAQQIPYAGIGHSRKDRASQVAGALFFLLRNGPSFALREQFGFEFVDPPTKLSHRRTKTTRRSRGATKKRKIEPTCGYNLDFF